jgi:hypothetical protein
MLIVDVSNLAHIGAGKRREIIYNDVSFTAIPFILSKTAGMVIDTENIIYVFDPKSEGKKLDYFRTYNPQVIFEVNVLYDLLKHIGFNAVRVPGYSADDIICNLADRYKNTGIKTTILTEDRDLVSAVYLDNETGSTTELLGPTVNGDHIPPYNMYALTNVPYNFMNVFKTILGCKSDRIKPLEKGSLLWKEFLQHIALKKRFQIRGKVETAYQFLDITLYNNKEYLLNWLAEHGVDGSANADAVYPKLLDTDAIAYKKVDWRLYNTMFNHMLGKLYINQRQPSGTPNPATIEFIAKTIAAHKVQGASVFEALPAGALSKLQGLEDFNIGV